MPVVRALSTPEYLHDSHWTHAETGGAVFIDKTGLVTIGNQTSEHLGALDSQILWKNFQGVSTPNGDRIDWIELP